MINEKYCVCDTETWAAGDKPDPDQDELRYVGFKSYYGKKVIYHYSQVEEIQRALDYFPIIVGHNFDYYDKPVLERHGFKIPWSKVIIDTLKIAKSRYKQMLYLDLPEKGFSLSNLCETFNLEHIKSEMDYSILEADKLEGDEYKILEDYLYADLDSTEDLFKYNYEMFYGLRQFMNDKDKERMKWLTSSSGATAYKCICNMAGLPEEYDEDISEDTIRYSGGYVSQPYTDKAEGDIYCCDFRNLYPAIFVGGNLYSPSKDGWNGSGVYPSVYANDVDGIVGYYSRDVGPIESFLIDMFHIREQAKKDKDKKLVLAAKIISNTSYGISGSPKFKSVYNLTTAADCTAMARRSIKHARTVFEQNGYECLYGDTDSAFIVDPYKDFDRLKKVCELITNTQLQSMNNTYNPIHDFEIESKIKRMYFFPDETCSTKKNVKYLKKFYIYVTDDDKIVTKGIRVVKGDCSPIAVKVYEDVIKPSILAGCYEPYDAEFLYDITKEIAKNNTDLLTKRFRVKSPESYKATEGKDEATSIQYQVSKRYGAGEHFMVANRRIGAGKGVKYAPMQDLIDKYGERWIDQVKYGQYVNDLKCFIKLEQRNQIEKLDSKRV